MHIFLHHPRWLWLLPLLSLFSLAMGCTGLLEVLDTNNDNSPKPCAVASARSQALRLIAYDPAFGPDDITHPTVLQRRFLNDANKLLKGCLAHDRSNLILLPDGMSELFALSGNKALIARQSAEPPKQRQALTNAYATSIAAYRRRFANLDDNAALGLALSNVIRSGAQLTAAQLAKTQSAFVAIALRLPLAMQDTTSVNEHAIFGDDQFNPTTVYVAAVSTLVETTMVFGPDGNLFGAVPRGFGPSSATALFTATPQPANKFSLFTLPLSDPTGQRSLRLAFWGESETAAIGLLQRLDDLGADLLLLHGRLPQWAVMASNNAWIPDQALTIPWLATQRLAMLYGGAVAYLRSAGVYNNDGQGYIAEKIGVNQTLAAKTIGGQPTAGLLAVSPWALAATAANIDSPDNTGRSALAQLALQLLGTPTRAPTVPQQSGLAVADIYLPSSGANAFSNDTNLGVHRRGIQAASINNQVLAVWQQELSSATQLHWGFASGNNFVSQGILAGGSSRSIRPRLAATPTTAVSLWMQGGTGQERIRRATYDAAHGVWSEAQLAESSTTAQWWPDLTLIGADIYAVWYALQTTSISLEVRRLATDGTSSGSRLRQWLLKSAASQIPVGPAAITSTGDQLWVVWSEQHKINDWQVMLLHSSDLGSTWSMPITVASSGNGQLIWDLTIEANADHVELAWSLIAADRRHATVVLASRQADGSFTVQTPSPANDMYQLQPTLALNGDSTWLAWRQIGANSDQLWAWSFNPDFGEISAKPILTADSAHFGQFNDPFLLIDSNVLLLWADGAAGYWQLRSLDLGTP